MNIEEIRAIKKKISEELGKEPFEVMQKRFNESTKKAEARIEEIRKEKEMA